jgi:hypothetical protein
VLLVVEVEVEVVLDLGQGLMLVVLQASHDYKVAAVERAEDVCVCALERSG